MRSARTNQLSAGLDLISGAIKAKSGNVVQYAGDAVLADFGSVVAAVDCAVSIQRQLAESITQVPAGKRLRFRIGVNLGEVIVDRDDIYGDGVNVAARLEGLAEPGGICISAAVHDQVRGQLGLAFEDMGAQEVKNITEPVRVYRWRAEENTSARAPKPAGSRGLPEKPAIAVLPFTNMSNDADGGSLSSRAIRRSRTRGRPSISSRSHKNSMYIISSRVVSERREIAYA